MVFASLKVGLRRSWTAKRMLFIYFLTNLFCGLLLAMPFRSTLSSKVGNTLYGGVLAGRIDMNFLFDFLFNHRDLGAAWFGLVIVVPLFYLLTNIFFSGGALAVFASPERYSATLFWSGAAKSFGRFLRLWLMSLPVFAVFFLIMFLEKGVTRLLFGADPYQHITYWAGWARVGLFGLAALLSYMFFDYARIYSVLHDERRMRRAWWAGLKFMFANFGKTLLLVVMIALLGVIALAIYHLAVDRLAAPQTVVILAMFLLQQVYMFVRIFMKLSTFAAQTVLYRAITAAAPAVTTAPAMPGDASGLPEASAA